MIDHSNMKLGKLSPRLDPRTLQLANYLDTTVIPPSPPERDWSGAIG